MYSIILFITISKLTPPKIEAVYQPSPRALHIFRSPAFIRAGVSRRKSTRSAAASCHPTRHHHAVYQCHANSRMRRTLIKHFVFYDYYIYATRLKSLIKLSAESYPDKIEENKKVCQWRGVAFHHDRDIYELIMTFHIIHYRTFRTSNQQK